jgi:hypothetical protein
MPRATLRQGRDAQEIGAAIVATWFKVLPTAVPIRNITFTQPLSVRTDWQAFKEGDEVWLTGLKGQSSLNEMKFKVGGAAPVQGEFLLLDLNDQEIDGSGETAGFTDAVLTSSVIRPLDDPAIMDELKYVLSRIIEEQPEVVVDDPSGTPVHIVVPRIPPDIRSRQDLIDYLRDYHQYAQGRHYHEELGVASVMGCR